MNPYRDTPRIYKPAPPAPWWRVARAWASGRLKVIEVRRLISNIARDYSKFHNLPLGMLFAVLEEANSRPQRHRHFHIVLAGARELHRRKDTATTSGGGPG